MNMTEEQAKKLYESRFWKTMTSRERATFQLYQDRLCMPFSIFHQAIEETLDRHVYTHEFCFNRKGLKKELNGESPAPTMEEIINLIPEEKRLIIFT